MERIDLHIESLIFAAEKPVSLDEIKLSLDNYFDKSIDEKIIAESINVLSEKYKSSESSFHIIEISNGFTFATKRDFHDIIGIFLKTVNKSKLSRAALETLAVVAYNQPTTKPVIEQIRGVNCDYSIQKLLDKNLIEISGREEGPGKPLIYQTNQRFLDYFGIKSIKDLPDLKEFNQNQNSVGTAEEE